MKIWKKLILLSFVVIFSDYIFAKSIVFSCVQNNQAPESANKISFLVEDLVFLSLFDAGLIASNLPLTTNEAEIIENIKNVDSSLEEKCEYILIINLEYNAELFIDQRTNEKVAQIEKMLYSLFNVQEKKIVYKKSVNISKSNTKKDLVKKLEKENNKIMKVLLRRVK